MWGKTILPRLWRWLTPRLSPTPTHPSAWLILSDKFSGHRFDVPTISGKMVPLSEFFQIAIAYKIIDAKLNRIFFHTNHLPSKIFKLRRINGFSKRARGIEPLLIAWKAKVLPLNYARKSVFKEFKHYILYLCLSYYSILIIQLCIV